MESIRLDFNFDDHEVAKSVAHSNPPTGVIINEPKDFIKASGGTGGGVFTQLLIQFLTDCNDLTLGLLAAVIFDCYKKHGKKNSHINGKEISLNKRNIVRLIKETLEQERASETDWHQDKKRKSYNRKKKR